MVKKLLVFSVCFCAISMVLPSSVFAAATPTTYYVDKDSVGGTCSDTSNGTAVNTPFCTFTKAHSVIVPGDTVYFRRGTYASILITKSGNSEGYLKFASYPGERAIIDAAGAPYGIKADQTQFVEINGFEVKNAGGDYSGGIYVRGLNVSGTDYSLTKSAHHRILNNIIHDNNVGGKWTFGLRVINSSYNLIQNNQTYNNFKCGITVEGNPNVTLFDNQVLNNISHDNNDGAGDADGICVYGNRNIGMIIKENTVYDNGDDGIDVWDTNGTLVEKNVAYNQVGNGDGNGLKAGGSTTGGGNTFRYNISYGNKANGLTSNGSGGNLFYNNVAFNNGEYGFEDGWRTPGSSGCSAGTSRCNTTLINNIGFNNAVANLSAGANTTTSDYNLWFSSTGGAKVSYDYVVFNNLSSFRNASGMNLDAHSLSVNPQFVNAGGGDFHLKSTSPAINVGNNLGLTSDFENHAVPVGSAPDMGAYEMNSTVNPTATSVPGSTAIPTSPVNPTATIVFNADMCSAADINGDGTVDLSDYSILVHEFLKSNFSPPSVDITKDGSVDLSDYSILVKYFLVNCSPQVTPTATTAPTSTIAIVSNTPTKTPTTGPTKTPAPTAVPGANLPAFPGAEGFGTQTKGGRGGKVILVTNLNDSGPGSLRDAVEVQTGPRVVVFTTGGTITLSRPLELVGANASYVTIEGQTAPGGGIQIKDYGMHLYHGVHDVVIRYMRIRVGQRANYNFADDTDDIEIWGGNAPVYNVVIDHVSAEWALDENLSIWDQGHDITYQYNIIAECSLDGQDHVNAKGLIAGTDTSTKLPQNLSIHHNVFASNADRNPRIAFADTDYRNNIIYNWSNDNSTMFGEYQSSWGFPTRVNAVNNIWKRGPSSGSNTAIYVNKGLQLFVQGNWSPLCPTGCSNDWSMGLFEEFGSFAAASEGTYRKTTQFAYPAVTTDATSTLMSKLLPKAGASMPVRDAVDTRIMNNVTAGTGSTGIGSGYPTLATGTAPTDTDQDGMPNTWEQANGLNSSDKADAVQTAPSGYTWIEEYANSLAN